VLVKTSKTKTNTTMLQFKSNHRFDKLQEISLIENEIVEKTFNSLNLLTEHRGFFIKHIVKVKGYVPLSILKVLFVLPYLSLPNVLSIYKTGLKQIAAAGKDVFYKFKNNNLICWRNKPKIRDAQTAVLCIQHPNFVASTMLQNVEFSNNFIGTRSENTGLPHNLKVTGCRFLGGP